MKNVFAKKWINCRLSLEATRILRVGKSLLQGVYNRFRPVDNCVENTCFPKPYRG